MARDSMEVILGSTGYTKTENGRVFVRIEKAKTMENLSIVILASHSIRARPRSILSTSCELEYAISLHPLKFL